jgi:hypothetical protein
MSPLQNPMSPFINSRVNTVHIAPSHRQRLHTYTGAEKNTPDDSRLPRSTDLRGALPWVAVPRASHTSAATHSRMGFAWALRHETDLITLSKLIPFDQIKSCPVIGPPPARKLEPVQNFIGSPFVGPRW